MTLPLGFLLFRSSGSCCKNCMTGYLLRTEEEAVCTPVCLDLRPVIYEPWYKCPWHRSVPHHRAAASISCKADFGMGENRGAKEGAKGPNATVLYS